MATKKTSTKFDTAHNIETEADLTNKTATVKNLVTGETYAGGGEGLPDISAGDAGKVLAVSDELAAEWAEPAFVQVLNPQTDNEVLSYNTLRTLLAGHRLPYTDVVFTEDNEEIHTIHILAFLSGNTNNYIAKFSGATSNGQFDLAYYVSSDPDAPMVLD